MQLIFLHGIPLDGRMWDEQRVAFPGSIVVPSLYPLGDSLPHWANSVLELTDSDDLVLVGSSCGGSCALEMARARPDRITALILVGSKAAHHPDPVLRDGYIRALRKGGIASLWTDLGGQYFGPRSPAASVARGLALALEQHTDDLVKGTEAFHSRPDASDVVQNWKKPFAKTTASCRSRKRATSRSRLRVAVAT